MQAFLDARVVRSSHYRDIAPAFLGWLAATGWGQDRWPFLLELAHAEILEVLVARFPDSDPPEGLHADPAAEDAVVLDSSHPGRVLHPCGPSRQRGGAHSRGPASPPPGIPEPGG